MNSIVIKKESEKLLCKDCIADCLIKNISDIEVLANVEKNKTVLKFHKNQKVLHEGMPVYNICFIQSGIVKVYKGGQNEKNHIIRFSKSGDILGHRGMISERYPISATALEDSLVCHFPRNYFIELLSKNQFIAYTLLMFYAKELEKSEIKGYNLANMNVREKIAECILFLYKRFGDKKNKKIGIALSRQDWADYAGTTKEQVSKIISEFNLDSYIEIDKKDIYVKNIPALEKIASNVVGAPN